MDDEATRDRVRALVREVLSKALPEKLTLRLIVTLYKVAS